MNWFEMSLAFKLFNKKNFGKMDLRASKKKWQIQYTLKEVEYSKKTAFIGILES